MDLFKETQTMDMSTRLAPKKPTGALRQALRDAWYTYTNGHPPVDPIVEHRIAIESAALDVARSLAYHTRDDAGLILNEAMRLLCVREWRAKDNFTTFKIEEPST